MTETLSKKAKKDAKNTYKNKEADHLRHIMPISAEDLNQLLWQIDEALSACKEGCDHSLTQTEKVIESLNLGNHRQEIIEWLVQSGGCCDCEVLFNVSDTYEFLLNELDNSYGAAEPNDDFDQHRDRNVTDINPIPPNWGTYKCTKLKYLNMQDGPTLTSIPKPWTLFVYDRGQHDFKILCYGKAKGVGNKFCSYIFNRPLAVKDDDQSLIHAWSEINDRVFKYAQVSADFLISRSVIQMGERQVQQIMLENASASAKTLWIYDPQNPCWYMLIAHTPIQLKSELTQFHTLMKHALYDCEGPSSPDLKEESPRTVTWITSEDVNNKGLIQSIKGVIWAIFGR